MRFLRQSVWQGAVYSPCENDFGDAIEFEQKMVNGQPMIFLWTVQEGKKKSGLLLDEQSCIRISLVS
jgi:hypothetical protein